MEMMARVYLIICCFFSLVCSTATLLWLLPVRQQKVQNKWCQHRRKKKQCQKKKVQQEREENREAGGRWFGKLQETVEAQSCVLRLSSGGKEDTSHKQQ